MSDESNEVNKVRRRFKRLEINSFENDPIPIENSPKSHKTLKKRRYRQLERHNIDELFNQLPAQIDSSMTNKKDRKTIKLNEKIIKKACATVDLISQKIKNKNAIQETVTASFVTNVIELTEKALERLQKQQTG